MPFALPFFFVVFLCFAQPVTAIFVLWLILAPFWATNAVGIASFVLQRLPLAASAEYLPSGRLSSKLPTGTSGTVLNVLDRDPGFADERGADEVDRDAVALEHDDQARERFAAVADEDTPGPPTGRGAAV